MHFALPEQANQAILHGLFCDGRNRLCQKHVPKFAVKHCSKCRSWKHDKSTCNHRVRCPRCAARSPKHTQKQCDGEVRCCNCDGSHHYRSPQCAVKTARMNWLRELEARSSTYFPETKLEKAPLSGSRKETHSDRFGNSPATTSSSTDKVASAARTSGDADKDDNIESAKRRKPNREPLVAVAANQPTSAPSNE